MEEARERWMRREGRRGERRIIRKEMMEEKKGGGGEEKGGGEMDGEKTDEKYWRGVITKVTNSLSQTFLHYV